MAGKDTANQSGRAIIAQQQGGMTEAADYLDAIRRLSMMVYRSVWGRVRQAWKEERWIRVTDNEKNVRFVGLNQPITVIQAEAKKLGVDKDNMDKADPQAVQYLQTLAQMPIAQQVTGVENNVAELDVDIIVDEGIDTPTAAAEQFDTLAKMMPGAPPELQPVLWKMLIGASALRDKDVLVEAMDQPPDPQQQQFQQMMQQFQAMMAEAEVRKTASEAAENEAQTQAIMANTTLDAFNAGASLAA
jgi:hypothetical protein